MVSKRLGFSRILIANRSEVALRIADAASQLGIETVTVHTRSEGSQHSGHGDLHVELASDGPAAYLDEQSLLDLAKRTGSDAVHPGYGFLSESSSFCRLLQGEGIGFIGSPPEVLDLFGDKPRAKALAMSLGVPILETALIKERSSAKLVVSGLLAELGSSEQIVLKASNGGGGRGIRIVSTVDQVEAVYDAVRAEVSVGFSGDGVFAERYLPKARHVEIQIAADAYGNVVALGSRDCSVQRRNQKLIEIAPAQGLAPAMEDQLVAESITLARSAQLEGLCTFEFLVPAGEAGSLEHYFVEANPRLQVENGVTEEAYGVDLVQTQIRLAEGASLVELGFDPDMPPTPDGVAIEVRITAERVTIDGRFIAAGGTVEDLTLATGAGIRIDSDLHKGMVLDGRFDPLLGKLIVHCRTGGIRAAVVRMRRALSQFSVVGVESNTSLLMALLSDQDLENGNFYTSTLEKRLADQADGYRDLSSDDRSSALDGEIVEIRAEMAATVVSVAVLPGDFLPAGGEILVVESMKMHHGMHAPFSATIAEVRVRPGQVVKVGELLALLVRAESESGSEAGLDNADGELRSDRRDIAELMERRRSISDSSRFEAVSSRHERGRNTARENLDLLCDAESFVELGGLAIASQRQRRTVQDLISKTPADGLIGGIGRINSELFPAERSSAIVVSYDYTVLAGTQGYQGHRKKDRLFELAERLKLPVVLFAEGGGGRPGDTDSYVITGLETMAFALFASLSGVVPLVGVVSGRCFAGNAALLGICDVIISTEHSNIGMGGPAMIEGGGLGVFRPDDIGPASLQYSNGVVDLLVPDDDAAVAMAKRYLSYFQGPLHQFAADDQTQLRNVVPQNRLRSYDVRTVVSLLSDVGSVMELRAGFGHGMVTSLVRIGGHSVGVIANNPRHLGGAIDATAADKAARFMKLCNGFSIPILFLCDTPGFMVGPAAEAEGQVRRFAKMFTVGAALEVPFFTVALRKGYGLGAQAMAGGSFRAPIFTVGWPTAEFGGMGLEGAVRLGYRKELEAATTDEEREELFNNLIAKAYENSKALNVASNFEIDDVIDPSETRDRILAFLASRTEESGLGRGRGSIDPW